VHTDGADDADGRAFLAAVHRRALGGGEEPNRPLSKFRDTRQPAFEKKMPMAFVA
jgi:hypothetical protein